jgi:type VII secretion protein EccE
MSARPQPLATGLRAHLGGFSPASNRRVASAVTVTVAAVVGWALGGHLAGWRWGQWLGAGIGAALAALVVVVPWLGQSAWSWLQLRLHGRQTISWSEPFTVANNRSGGGVRIEGGAAVVAVQLLGKAHAPTIMTGSTRVETANKVDVAVLYALMSQPLGLALDSYSTVIAGSRRSRNGDYARVYDTLIGTTQYGGQRESWLILRLNVIDNAEALGWRTTVGAAAIAVAHRVAGSLRCSGLRARVGTATDLTALDQRLGAEALTADRVQWKQVRTQDGWLTTYAYPADAIRSEVLAEAWTLPVDEVIQNVTVFADGSCTATVTVRTPQPLVAPPNVVLRPLRGEQAAALASAMCGPRPRLRGVPVGVLPQRLELEIGPSGVLLGKLRNGDRLLVPLTDSTEPSRVFISGDDPIVKRLVIRAQGSGDRLSVHTRDRARWASVRMPDVVVVGEPRPAPRSTISVIDGPMAPNPRPHTVITVAAPGSPRPGEGTVDVCIEQVNGALAKVSVGGQEWMVDMELFRAENRYCTLESVAMVRAPR